MNSSLSPHHSTMNVLMNYIDFLKIDLFSLDTASFYQNIMSLFPLVLLFFLFQLTSHFISKRTCMLDDCNINNLLLKQRKALFCDSCEV